jgi:hypothetical protein
MQAFQSRYWKAFCLLSRRAEELLPPTAGINPGAEYHTFEEITLGKLKPYQYRLDVKFDDEVLDEGWTGMPNILRNHYRDLGLKDQEFAWIIHLLVHQWTREPPRPRQQNLPMSASIGARRRYARHLRNLGLLFSTRRYYTAETSPEPELVGKLETLEYHLESLWHNLVRVARWKQASKPLEEFAIDIPESVLEKIVKGEYHDTPQRWIDHANQHVREIIRRHKAGEYIPEDQRWALLWQNGIVEGNPTSTIPKSTSRKSTSRKATSSFWHRQQEDSISREDSLSKEDEQHQQDKTAGVVVHPDDLPALVLNEDEVLVERGDQLLRMDLVEVVKEDIRQMARRGGIPSRLEVYYSVEHALGDGSDEWTPEEQARIARRNRLHRELEATYRRLGAFTLEEALQWYFSPQLAARILADKPEIERERIEGWVAYTRQAKGLNNPGGFLRTKIESEETAPPVGNEQR